MAVTVGEHHFKISVPIRKSMGDFEKPKKISIPVQIFWSRFLCGDDSNLSQSTCLPNLKDQAHNELRRCSWILKSESIKLLEKAKERPCIQFHEHEVMINYHDMMSLYANPRHFQNFLKELSLDTSQQNFHAIHLSHESLMHLLLAFEQGSRAAKIIVREKIVHLLELNNHTCIYLDILVSSGLDEAVGHLLDLHRENPSKWVEFARVCAFNGSPIAIAQLLSACKDEKMGLSTEDGLKIMNELSNRGSKVATEVKLIAHAKGHFGLNPKDESVQKRGFELTNLAINRGSEKARLIVLKAYLKGYFGFDPKDIIVQRQRLRLIKREANQGFEKAIHLRISCYSKGYFELNPKDVKVQVKALQVIKKYALEGSPSGLKALFRAYHKGNFGLDLRDENVQKEKNQLIEHLTNDPVIGEKARIFFLLRLLKEGYSEDIISELAISYMALNSEIGRIIYLCHPLLTEVQLYHLVKKYLHEGYFEAFRHIERVYFRSKARCEKMNPFTRPKSLDSLIKDAEKFSLQGSQFAICFYLECLKQEKETVFFDALKFFLQQESDGASHYFAHYFTIIL